MLFDIVYTSAIAFIKEKKKEKNYVLLQIK